MLRNQEHLTFVPLNAFMSRPNDKHMGIAGTFCPRNAQLDGFVVIAETREICKKIIVEFNSGLRKSVEKLISIVPERKSTFSNN